MALSTFLLICILVAVLLASEPGRAVLAGLVTLGLWLTWIALLLLGGWALLVTV